MSQAKRSQPIFFVFGIGVAIGICALLWLISFVLIVNLRPLHQDRLIAFLPGESLNQFSQNLHHINLVPRPFYFNGWAILLGKDHHLQTGYYRMTPDMSLNALLHKMVHGDVEHFKLMIIPGETLEDLLEQISQTGIQVPAHDRAQWQGTLYPNTYDYDNDQTLLEVLNRSQQEMQNYLNQAWPHRNKNALYQNPFQVLIMASILEKESSSFEDQEHMASVFMNRLQKGMYLDSDATVRYAVGAKPGVPLQHSDFKSNSYFNTYRFKSLPPAPICFVNLQTIQAALHPLTTNDLYFLTNAQGQTIFSPNPIHLNQEKALS
jgi:UPF0755 protein